MRASEPAENQLDGGLRTSEPAEKPKDRKNPEAPVPTE